MAIIRVRVKVRVGGVVVEFGWIWGGLPHLSHSNFILSQDDKFVGHWARGLIFRVWGGV